MTRGGTYRAVQFLGSTSLSDLCSADPPSDWLNKSCPDHFYNSAIDLDTDKTNPHDKKEVTVNSLEERQHGISGPLTEQAVDGCSVTNQSLSVINAPASEESFDKMIYNYTHSLFYGRCWLFNEADALYDDNSFDWLYSVCWQLS